MLKNSSEGTSALESITLRSKAIGKKRQITQKMNLAVLDDGKIVIRAIILFHGV